LNQNLWLLELEDVEKNSGRLVQKLKVAERKSKSTKSYFTPNDVLYGKLRPYLNKVVVADEEGYSTTEIVAIRSYSSQIDPRYTAIALRNPNFVSYVEKKGQGTKMPRLRTEDAVTSYFPLPPLAEQKRIVAKVDELMALCDRLEQAQNERENQRQRFVAATHHQLNATDESAPQAIRLLATELPTLTARPADVTALRQTILNLAVRGKLVPQDPNDEPATELLNLIVAEKERLISEKVVKKSKTNQPWV